MSTLIRWSLAAVVLFPSAVLLAQEKGKDGDTVENPYFKYWSKSKVGASVDLKETTKTPARDGTEASEEVKLISHKLVELTPEKAVVETTVTEGEVFGFVQSAPAKHIYPAKMNKDVYDALLRDTGAKKVEETVKVDGKDYKVYVITGTSKNGDEEVNFKIWLSDEVPGGIAKRVRTTMSKGQLVAETTTELFKFKKD